MQWLYLMLVFVFVRTHDIVLNYTRTPENLISTPCTDKNHFFMAPGVLTAGGTNRACLSRFFSDGPARVILSLIAEDKQTVTASRELPPGDGGCLDISVPLLPNTKADLVVNVWYPEVKCTWERRVTLRISSGKVVVVHTERARYKPGETLRARVFALKADLTPAPGNIEEIWIEAPPGAWEGTRVAEWTKVRSKMGLAQVQHDIDEQAPPGRWTVRAKLGDGSQGSAVFWVGNYELPPFQLTVRHAPRVLRTSERLVWTVCVRYPWTEAVEGMLVIRLRGAGSESGGVRTAVRLRAPRACHRHAAAAGRVGLGGSRPPDVVVADFSFQEEGTRIWQNTTVVSQVVDKPIYLEWVTKPRTVISPGLPYKLKVKATRWDDKPAPNERIRICRYAGQNERQNDTPTCVSGDTDTGGVARVMFAAEDDGSSFYRFEAALSNDSTITTGPLSLSTRRSPTQAALGPLRAESRGSRTFVPLYLSLQNVTTPVTVHFVVITRGGIIYRWGATTQCPIASSAPNIQTAPRNTKCSDPMSQYYEDSHDANKSQYSESINNDNNSKQYTTRNGTNKIGRNYDPKTNQYIRSDHHNEDDKTGFIIRNMNQNDKNSYLHKNFDPNDKNHTIYDRFSPVYVKTPVNKVDINSVQYEANASDSLLDRFLLRVMLPIKVTQQMCPDSHLIAYFYYNGEFVSASKHFEMDDCFVNKVEANFLSRQALPGSQTTLQISTPGPALCALTALDSAAKYGAQNVKEVLMKGLKKMIDGHRNITEYDAAGNCFLSSEYTQQPTNSLEQAATWLAAAGVRTIRDIALKTNCDSPASLIDEGTVPRNDFSEAWLWRLVTVGANGTITTSAKAPESITRYEANAVCLSKAGIAVSQPAVLQVFREFFIHADSPRRLKRGDSTIIRYRLFNYLYEPLSVQIQILTGTKLQGPLDLVESICISPRTSAARRASIIASGVGETSVSIRAKAIRDGQCGNSTSKRGVSDEVIINITVEPEGVPVQEHKSMLLCAKDESNSTKSEVFWRFPPASSVPGTESLIVWATGDLVGPLLADADSLVVLPRGCGEQNMARLATNLLALTRLDPRCAAALSAREHVARGFTRQLQYIHPSGGFSAFGPSDTTSSTWLTAFSLRYMRKAHKLLWPGQPIPPAIEKAENWLLNQQMENGCFRNEGQVFHRELRGGLNEEGEIASVALTAYVIMSLIQSSSPLPPRALRASLSCLRALPRLKYSPRVYAHALLAYAFVKLRNYEEDLRRTNEAKYEDLRRSKSQDDLRSGEVSWMVKGGLKENEGLLEVMELIKMARREGEYLWWETEGCVSQQWEPFRSHCWDTQPDDDEVVRGRGDGTATESLTTSEGESPLCLLQESSLATSIEATSYALLALRESPAVLREFGAGAVRWLGAHRGPSGGFVSTQDTLVGLEALSAWSSLQPSPSNLTVSVRSGTVSKIAALDPEVHVPEVMRMGAGNNVDITVKGSGCALVQATRSYHSPSSDQSHQSRLSVQLSVHTDGTFDCDAANNCFCAAVIEACVVWSGSFPEMALMEISLPSGYGVDASKLYAQLNQQNSLLRRIEVPGSGTRVTLYLAARGPLPPRGHACYPLHTVGAAAATRPGHARLSDYYSPNINDSQSFTIPEDCPSRVSHESSRDLTSDNVYNGARSHSENGEILITHEFSFEDIPEGIPLEDPLYENLRRNDTKDDLKRSDGKNDTIEALTAINRDYLPYNGDFIKDIAFRNNIIIRAQNPAIIENRKHDSRIHIDDKLDLGSVKAVVTYNKAIGVKTKEIIGPILTGHNIDKVDTNDKSITAKADNFMQHNLDSTTPLNMYNEQRSIEVTTSTISAVKENFQNIHATEKVSSNEITEIKPNHRIEIRDEHENKPEVENPKLTDFHVIDSEKDLEVPSGIEGPVPAIILPPPNFVPSHLPPPENYGPIVPSDFKSQNVGNSFLPQKRGTNNFAPQNVGPNFVAQQVVPSNYVPHIFQATNYGSSYMAPVPQNFAPIEDYYSNQHVNVMPNYYRRRIRNGFSSG